MEQKEIIDLAKKYMSKWDATIVKPSKILGVKQEMTLVGQLNSAVLNTLELFIIELKKIDPDQTYYTKNDLHLTLLGGVNPNTKVKENKNKLKLILEKYTLEFNFTHIIANHSGLAILAIPIDFNISELRASLRSALDLPEVPYKNSALFENSGWVSILRFTNTPSENLVDFIRTNINRSFCAGKLKNITVYKINNIIFGNDENTKKLLEFAL